jgi:hypothetical protein
MSTLGFGAITVVADVASVGGEGNSGGYNGGGGRYCGGSVGLRTAAAIKRGMYRE